jgi:uncharacterized C2H2 Zn-finger protein
MPCPQCGMRIRKNEPWHNENHQYDENRGRVVVRRYNETKKMMEVVPVV